MKVIMVNGSPNINGCTSVALKEIEKELNRHEIETEIVNMGSKDIRGCVACQKCSEKGCCVFDDGVNEFVDKCEKADGFIFAGPVYYGSVNPTLTNFLTRAFYSSVFGGRKVFRLKPGAAVTSARRAGTMTSLDILNRFFTWGEMPIISSTYWNEIHGATAEDAKKDLEGLQTMRNLANNMAWFLKIRQLSIKEGIPLPESIRTHHTNFIR